MSDIVNVGVLFCNNESFVEAFFLFLRKATRIDIRVFCVDNGSIDDTYSKLCQAHRGNDVVVRLDSNVGIARGRNVLLDIVKQHCGEYTDLLLLDSDLFIIGKHCVETIQQHSIDNSNVGISLGTHYSFWKCQPGELGICFSYIKKAVFDTIGGFDEYYKMFYDDCDFFKRAENAGFVIDACNKAESVHMHGGTTFVGSEGGERREKCLIHDKDYYERKWKKGCYE